MNPKISICLPVYNQKELVSLFLKRLLTYQGDDIEIIINDDNSTDDILSIVNGFNDQRIKYFKNETNLGHDLNIISCFKHCSTNYAYLFRTRDYPLVESIDKIVETLQEHKDISFLTGGAIYEDGKQRFTYKGVFTTDSKECLELHKKVYIHPSGFIYNLSLLDIDKLESFIKKNVPHRFGFLVHRIARIELATHGGFCLLPFNTWVYSDTSLSKDKAVNASKDKESIYSAKYELERARCEFWWIKEIGLDDEQKESILPWIYEKYLFAVTWGLLTKNNDVALQQHYSYKKEKISVKQNTKQFNELAKATFEECGFSSSLYKKTKRKKTAKNNLYYSFRYCGVTLLKKLKMFRKVKNAHEKGTKI